MNTKQCLHTHTTYADGKDTPEALVLTAMEKGFGGIGFSEHTYMPFSDYPYQMKVEDMPRYKREVLDLKEKYRGRIDIFCGLEFESFCDAPAEGYDYLIGSVHYVEAEGQPRGFDKDLACVRELIDRFFGGDAMTFARRYYETVANLPRKHDFDILGHFDILTKNNELGRFLDTSSKAYLDLGFEAIHALKGKIPLFEVNTGAMSRGYRTSPYPQLDFIKEFYACGFGAVITSDCHDRNFLDCGFEQARELLLEAGFKTKWIMTDNGFKEVTL